MIILKTSDKLPCQIGHMTVWVSPLSWAEKTKLMRLTKTESGEVQTDQTQVLFETLKQSIKKVDLDESLKYADGSKPSVEFDEDGLIADESLETVIRIAGMAPMSNLSAAVLSEALHEDIQGVSVKWDKVQTESKKKTS